MATDKFFGQDYPDDNINRDTEQEPVTVLGQTFKNDEERRRFFREELRKMLPELKKIEGFPIGEDEDIVNLSDPPYYTACPNPWLNDFIKQWEEEKKQLEHKGKRKAVYEVKEPYASDVSEGKNNPIYMVHSYHTKAPHPAIMRYILHYTQPGDIVLDGFAGTGMTGVAAQLCCSSNDVNALGEKNIKEGVRHCICSDLSPIATHIAATYNCPFDLNRLKRDALALLDEAEQQYGWMYKSQLNGKEVDVNYYIWSETFICPNCGNTINLWKDAVLNDGEIIKSDIVCPHCSATTTKSKLEKKVETVYDKVLGETITQSQFELVRVNYVRSKDRGEFDATDFDHKLLKDIYGIDVSNTPHIKMPLGSEAQRNDGRGISHAHQFFSYRNLVILDYLWKKMSSNTYLLSLLTASMLNISKMWKFKPDRKGGSLTGTLYIPSLYIEQNPFNVIRRKITSFNAIDYPGKGNSIISTSSATQLDLANSCIDYIFIDPPFGANLMYSQLNIINESIIRVITSSKEEAIVDSQGQHKDIFDYQRLMNSSLREFYRILKPGKWLTMEFSNTSASVWNSIQNALQGVGFIVANVSALDKQQGSFKAITTTTAVKQDLVITCYKPSNNLTDKFLSSCGSKENVWDFIEEHLHHLPVHIEKGNATTSVIERSPKILFDRMISYFVQKGYSIPMDAQEFQQGLRERYAERDGMYFTATQAAEYDEKRLKTPEFVPMGIIVSDEANGIEWLKNKLREKPQTRQDLHSDWTKAKAGVKKGDKIPELDDLLEENFIKNEDGTWRLPNVNDNVDKETLRTKALLKEFKIYLEVCRKPRGKLKDVRIEAVRAGFKQCYSDKNFADIILVGDRIPQNLLTEDEILLQYYDIASSKV